jgi:hypothetical protein
MTPAPSPAKDRELKGSSGRTTKMQFVITGFTQELGCRVFAFEGIAVDRMRTSFTVRADLALIRRYGIRIQELPLLCRNVLERRDEASETQTFIFTEEEMRDCATARAAAKDEAAQRKRPPRRHSTEGLGAAWRAPQP